MGALKKHIMKTEIRPVYGHIAAAITILIWGTTMVSTKVLLNDFKPIEILLLRFILGAISLVIACPCRLKGTTFKQEGMLFLAGLLGVCMYYMLENVALAYSMASNVSVIISASPLFTALLGKLLLKGDESPKSAFYIGFVVAVCGIILIVFNGKKLELNPLGDILALFAAVCWAAYSLVVKKINSFGYNVILTTRRIFEYGLLCMTPILAFSELNFDMSKLCNSVNMLNLLFLGICASALCFVTWNTAIGILGPVKTTTYIYIIPVISVAASAVVLHERITALAAAGMALIIAGLVLSGKEGTSGAKHKQNKWEEET